MIQGAVRPLLTRQVTSTGGSAESVEQLGGLAAFAAALRHDATELLVAQLGDAHVRELHAEGVAMDETAACRYSRAHIDGLLARGPDPLA